MQQRFNSNYHKNFTTNKENRKTFLNFMHGGGGGGLKKAVALFGKKQNWITWLSWKLIP